MRFTVPLAPARDYFDGPRRNIQDMFPELAPALREILVTGTTPAEWDRMFDGLPETLEEFMEKYRPLGYRFEEDPEPDQEED